MHYLEKQRIKVEIGKNLRKLGWELIGYDSGVLDPSTDYFLPASWDGVAVKGEITACISVSAYEAKKHKVNPTPKGRAWHIEKKGRILATGKGITKVARATDSEEFQKLAAKLAKEIDNAAKRHMKVTTTLPSFTRVGGWSWLAFPVKPSQDVLSTLKAQGWRWSQRRQAWYHPGGAEPPQWVLARIALTNPGA